MSISEDPRGDLEQTKGQPYPAGKSILTLLAFLSLISSAVFLLVLHLLSNVYWY